MGTAVLPAIGAYSGADKTTLGEGALASHEVLLEWGPAFDPYGMVVDLDDPDAATALAEDLEVPPPYFLLSTPASVPSDVESLERVQSTPLILTGMLAALIALTVIHALMAAVRSRRRELAVLRTFGFTRRQVVASVTMQALLIAAVGLLVGVPLGLVLGRVAWTARDRPPRSRDRNGHARPRPRRPGRRRLRDGGPRSALARPSRRPRPSRNHPSYRVDGEHDVHQP